ncbi:MAG: hypothetical protein K9J34_01960 [Rhodoferax sp.]|nr:hypothetical protein [Rhodoferax sp.]
MPFVNRVILIGLGASFMIFVLRPQIARLVPLNLVLGALAIAAVALWR